MAGTAGNDTFFATNNTLQAGDSVNGGAGTDTLFYTDASATGVNLVATALSGIEEIYVQNVAGTAAVTAVPNVSEKQNITVTVADATASKTVFTFLGVEITATTTTDASVATAIAAAKVTILAGDQAVALGVTDIAVASAGVVAITYGGANGLGDVALLPAVSGGTGISLSASVEATKGVVAVTGSAAVTPTQTVDATTLTDTVQFWNNASTNDVTFSNIQQAATIGVKGVTAGSETTAGFVAAVTKGTADSVSVVFDGSTDAGTVIVGTAGAGFETVNVTAIGENKVAALTTAAKTVNITGAGDLEITASLVGAKVIDGSAATGDLTIGAAETGADLESVKTGSGDDTVTIDEANFRTDSKLVVDLGAGKDTLVVAGALANAEVEALKFKGDVFSISGVETLSIGGAVTLATDDRTLNLDGVGASTLNFAADVVGDTQVLTISKFTGDTISFSELAGKTTALGLTAGDVLGGVTISTTKAAEFTEITLANATSLTVSATKAAFTSDDITAAKITTLTVDTGTAGTVNLNDLNTAALTTITVSGKADFAADIEAVATKVTSIDLSGLEGAATIDAGNSVFAGTVTVKVGEGGLDYTANTTSTREIFQFVGEEIGAVTLTGFSISSAATGDKLDFSQFANVSSLEDLVVVLVDPASPAYDFIRITAKDVTTGPDAFSGTIEIKAGADLASADITDLVANSFIF